MCGRYFMADFTEEEVHKYYNILDEIDRSIKANKDNKEKRENRYSLRIYYQS